GILFIPVRSLSQLMGFTVQWNGADRSIVISQGSAQADKLTFQYGFNKDDEGWDGGFADLPVGYDQAIYNLDYKRELIPLEGNTTNFGLKLSGMNRSDDLFMFATKKVEGLEPNTTYQAKLKIGMYTNQGGGMMGVGGAPGEAVSIKAGVLGIEPKAVQKDDGGGKFYQMNVDKGNQSVEGADAKIVGNITKPDSEKEGYQLVTFNYGTSVTTNANGECFILIGSDSGYEGLTTLYFDDIQLSLKK
ncbi:copper amine oxidase N-terminal domain-containing protein, partial [Paenibacillus sepulcri]|nr:copper amine oxidase N-terminal domain-containing protein [Paenibacillus sepulcri]